MSVRITDASLSERPYRVSGFNGAITADTDEPETNPAVSVPDNSGTVRIALDGLSADDYPNLPASMAVRLADFNQRLVRQVAAVATNPLDRILALARAHSTAPATESPEPSGVYRPPEPPVKQAVVVNAGRTAGGPDVHQNNGSKRMPIDMSTPQKEPTTQVIFDLPSGVFRMTYADVTITTDLVILTARADSDYFFPRSTLRVAGDPDSGHVPLLLGVHGKTYSCMAQDALQWQLTSMGFVQMVLLRLRDEQSSQ